jgi:O-acetyl-ADP-ribose deacetylase (regulator of RNase III)
MIIKVSGDILLTSAQAIAHAVAPADHFENGLALALREQWPAMVRDFRHYCHQNHAKPGEVWMWGGPEGKVVISLMVQEPVEGPHSHGVHPGPATLSYVNHALKALRHLIDSEKISSLALPRLATGVGKLDWADVEPLIEQHLGSLDIPVYVYETYVKGERAEEPAAKAA